MEQSLIDFLHYVEHSDMESLPLECDERLKHLHEKIQNIKSNEQMGVTYMKMEERDRLIREEGIELGMKSLLKTCKNLGAKREEILAQIQKEFSLSKEKADTYMMKYWDGEIDDDKNTL